MKIFRFFPALLLVCLLLSLISPPALAEGPETGETGEALTEALVGPVQTSAASAPAGEAPEPPKLTAKAVYLVDLESGFALYSKDADASRSPASLTKVMTVLLALEAVERGEVGMDTVITAGLDCQNGMNEDSSSVYIVAGEKMSLKDLLYCAAVSSGNDACNVIASYLGGDIPGFVRRMNARAAELGCTQTRFVDPNGLSYDNLTTAYELYLITRAAMEHPAFMEICDTTAYTVAATNLSNARELKNSNALISTQGIYGASYLYEGAHGVKTGYTRAAGYCLISTAERDGMRLMAIVMGCDGPYLSDTDTRYNFVDTVLLYDWAFANFKPRTIITAGEVLDYADVALAGGEARVGLTVREDVSLPLPINVPLGKEEIVCKIDRSLLIAPIEAGTILGYAAIQYNGRLLRTVPLVAAEDVARLFPLDWHKILSDYMTRIWSTS